MASENCQHIDEAILAMAEPRLYHGAWHSAFCRMDRGGEANHLAGRGLGPTLLLIEAGVSGRGTGRARFLAAYGGGRDHRAEQQRDSQAESMHGNHGMCPRRAAVNPP